MGIKTEFGDALERIREDRGETQTQMASRINMVGSYLSRVEHGKAPIPSYMVGILCARYDLCEEEISDIMTAEKTCLPKALPDFYFDVKSTNMKSVYRISRSGKTRYAIYDTVAQRQVGTCSRRVIQANIENGYWEVCK